MRTFIGVIFLFSLLYIWYRRQQNVGKKWGTTRENEYAATYSLLYDRFREAIQHYDPRFIYSTNQLHREEVDTILRYITTYSRFETNIVDWTIHERGAEGEVFLTYTHPVEEMRRRRAYVQEQLIQIIRETTRWFDRKETKIEKLIDYITMTYTPTHSKSHEKDELYTLLSTKEGSDVAFARLFVALLDILHVENYFVRGQKEGRRAAWNCIAWKKTYRMIDLTAPSEKMDHYVWDDTQYPL